MPVNGAAMHLIRIERPRPTYLMGPRELLAQARKMRILERGGAGSFTFQGIGEIHTFDIKIAGGTVHEIEEASALQIIRTLGLVIDEEGIPLEAMEGA